MGFDRLSGSRSFWPPFEATRGETLLGEPEPLAVVREKLDHFSTACTKHEDAARERIVLQFLATQVNQRVDPLPTVDRLKRDKHAHLGRDLQHLGLPTKLADDEGKALRRHILQFHRQPAPGRRIHT